ncbi:hypothetical protein MAR_019024, partial [Mya arenaria]
VICSLCIRHQRRPKKCPAGRATRVEVPCTTVRRQACKTLQDSDSHKEAVVFESTAATTAGGRDSAPYEVRVTRGHHQGMGMDVLNMLTLEGNANYTINDFVHKKVVLFGNVIFRDIVAEIQHSPFYSVMIDGTTDIATYSQLTIYVRYLHMGASKTLTTGSPDTIRAAVVQFLPDAELPLNRMWAFGSDGAAAMLG